MKFLYCKKCNDMLKIIPTYWRTCMCGKSAARYDPERFKITHRHTVLGRGLFERREYTFAQVCGEGEIFGIGGGGFDMAFKDKHFFTGWFYGDLVPDHGEIDYLEDLTIEDTILANARLVRGEEFKFINKFHFTQER